MTFEDDLLALERRVLADSAGDYLAAVDELRHLLAMDGEGLVGKLARLAIPQMEAKAASGIAEAYALGAAWALNSLVHTGENGVDKSTKAKAESKVATAPAALSAPLDGLDELLASSKATALLLVRNGATVDAALAPVFHAANRAQSTVETQINAASNRASLGVGEAVRSPMVWEAERDACVFCLALSGEVVEEAGSDFPNADRYDLGKMGQQTVQQPPLHPHCRCRIAILNDPSYADALRREADRSILRGFSLTSESNAVRIRAAKRLLDADPVAPKSVKEYARKAVREGHFPRGRDVPEGDPRLVIK